MPFFTRPRLLGCALSGVALFLAPGLLSAQSDTPKRYALLVGVNEYEHEKLPKLDYAVNDAHDLAGLLKQSGYQITLLSDRAGRDDKDHAPTRVNIERELKSVLDRAGKKDTVLIALAGHGMQFEGEKDAYFCPTDARPFKDRTDSLVSLGGMYRQLEQSFAGVKVLLVDACRDDPDAGRGTRGVNADNSPRPPSGVAALFSCRAGERAFEHSDLKHGVFFHHVLLGLQKEAKDRKGRVTFAGLAAYVNEEVPDWVAKHVGDGARQSPNLKADYSSEPVLIDAGGGFWAIGDYDLTGGYRFVRFGTDGVRVVLHDARTESGYVRVYDLSTERPVTPLLRHVGKVVHAAFSADGARVVTASWDKTARVWNTTTGEPITPPLKHEGAVWHAAFSPDGTRVVTAGLDGTARVWDAKTGQSIIQPIRHGERVRYATFSPDGASVVTGSSNGTARVWDAKTGEPITPALEHNNTVVWQAPFSADGTRVVTASGDETARVWDAKSGDPVTGPLKHDGHVHHAAFSADGARVVTADTDGTARIWNAKSGEAILAPLRHEGSIQHAAFSRDGTRVVTASKDKTARVWDAKTGEPITPPLKHESEVVRGAFSPDGTRVVTSTDDEAHLWDAKTGQELAKVQISER